MESIFWGDTEGSFFSYASIAKTRRIAYPMLPNSISCKLPGTSKVRIPPKLPGEIRLLSADIALMASTRHNNDASALFLNQIFPTKAGRFSNNIVYTESNEGLRTEEEALKIRRLYEEYDCDYIVLDVKNFGLSIYDLLSGDMADPETGEIYPALSCCNNPDLAARCTSRSAQKAVWAISGTASFNSECAILLREGFRSGSIRLLMTEYDGEDALNTLNGFAKLNTREKAAMLAPFINTTLLIGELINLQHEESQGKVRLFERAGERKDRYSSLSYNYWVSKQLENESRKRESRNNTYNQEEFIFRAPKIKKSEGRALR